MKLLLLIYSGNRPSLVPELLDEHHAGGYTELRQVHGAGATGKREGSRAWPGDASVYFSIVPQERVEDLLIAVRQKATAMQASERLHAAVIPTETFF